MDFTFQLPPLFSPPPSQLSTSCPILIWRWRLNGGWFKSSSNSQARHKALQAEARAPPRAPRFSGGWLRGERGVAARPREQQVCYCKKSWSAPDANKAHELDVYLKRRRVVLPLWREAAAFMSDCWFGICLKHIFTFSVVARGVHVWVVDLDGVLVEFITLSRYECCAKTRRFAHNTFVLLLNFVGKKKRNLQPRRICQRCEGLL